jgi:hypothetical protein
MGIATFFPGMIGQTVMGYMDQYSPSVHLAGVNYMNYPTEILTFGLPGMTNTDPFAGAHRTSTSSLGTALGTFDPIQSLSMAGIGFNPFVSSTGGSEGLISSLTRPWGSPSTAPVLDNTFLVNLRDRLSDTLNSLTGQTTAKAEEKPAEKPTEKTEPKIDSKTKDREELRTAITQTQSKLADDLAPMLDKASNSDGVEREASVAQARNTMLRDLRQQGFNVTRLGRDSIRMNGKSFDLIDFKDGQATLQAGD